MTLGGVAAAAQGVVNADLGERAGNPGARRGGQHVGGTLLVLVGLALPSMRVGWPPCASPAALVGRTWGR
ncbi:hypothetical protein JNW88_27070, partial [Micromonospora sp. ATA32]|nr:hypothetical protein [Micromonospora sp. ATA32]